MNTALHIPGTAIPYTIQEQLALEGIVRMLIRRRVRCSHSHSDTICKPTPPDTPAHNPRV